MTLGNGVILEEGMAPSELKIKGQFRFFVLLLNVICIALNVSEWWWAKGRWFDVIAFVLLYVGQALVALNLHIGAVQDKAGIFAWFRRCVIGLVSLICFHIASRLDYKKVSWLEQLVGKLRGGRG